MECLGIPTIAAHPSPAAPPAGVADADTAPGGFALAALDIDDTLLGPDWRISDGNAAAVRALRDRGVRVVLASGRGRANTLRFHRALALGDAPIISAQGAFACPAALRAARVGA